MKTGSLHTELQSYIDQLQYQTVPSDRLPVINDLVDYIKSKKGKPVNLNFICTHNSRRSQLSQVWAQTAAAYFDVPVICYSGGVEVTAFNERAVMALKRAGFKITSKRKENPKYFILFSNDHDPIVAFSKVFDDPINPRKEFAAVMTCSDADENCPFIPGTELRIPLRYEDPKAFDGTPQEEKAYDDRSMQIASEMFYVFSKI